MIMIRTTDEAKGLVTTWQDGTGMLAFGRAKYDSKLGCWCPDSIYSMCHYEAFATKKAAVAHVKSMSWPQTHIERFGNRFGMGYAIREDIRSKYFLLTDMRLHDQAAYKPLRQIS